MPLRPDVRLSDAPIIQQFRKDLNISLRPCYLKTNEQYNSVFAIVVPDEKDVVQIVETKIDPDTIIAVQYEIMDLHYSLKMQRDPVNAQYKVTVTGLQKSANPSISLTAFSMSIEFLWGLTMWKLAALQFPLTYVQKERTKNDYGLS